MHGIDRLNRCALAIITIRKFIGLELFLSLLIAPKSFRYSRLRFPGWSHGLYLRTLCGLSRVSHSVDSSRHVICVTLVHQYFSPGLMAVVAISVHPKQGSLTQTISPFDAIKTSTT